MEGSPTTTAIDYVLARCQISPRHAGYRGISFAVQLTLSDKELLKQKTTKLYPMVAEALGKDWRTVESDIRYAMRYGLDRMEEQDYRYVFGCIPLKRPTVGEFIDAVAATVERIGK